MLFNPKLDVRIENKDIDEGGRYILANTKINDTELCLMNVYSPNKGKEQEIFLNR